ncbi:hypothetical protein FACS18949_04060 [Clostridia bacterium]|nr:hypothetical protein FACS18949_04060 [Clostridia bacterium]
MSNVLHLISGGDFGGAKTFVLSLQASFKLYGHNSISLACLKSGAVADGARAAGLDVSVIGGRGLELGELRRFIKSGDYDIIHSHGSRANFMSAVLAPSLKLPTVSTLHSDYRLDYLGSPLRKVTYGAMNRWALWRMDSIVGVSDAMTEMMINRGYPPSQAYTVYNGMDLTLPCEPVDKRAMLKEIGADAEPDDVIVAMAARMAPVKDFATLLRGFAAAARDCPKLKLILFGDGDLRPALERLTDKLGIRGRVTFAGWRKDPQRFFQAVDINVLCPLHEPFGYVLLEGAKFGLGTVATNVGGIPSIIDHGVNGLLFEPRDAEALAAHLKTLYFDEGLRKRYGGALREKSLDKFSVQRMVGAYDAMYDSILAKRARKNLNKPRDGVTICGAYGYRNAGDEAILGAILGRLREIDPLLPVTLLSRSPRRTAAAFRVDTRFTFNIFALSRAFKRGALYINGGGNLIQDATSSRSLWFYLFTLWLAKRRGAKTLMYACGIGPVRRPFNKRLAAKVLNSCVDGITMREDQTRLEMDALGIKIPMARMTADSALALKPADDTAVDAAFAELGLDKNTAYLCLSVRKWEGLKQAAPAFAAMMDAAWKEFGMTTLILPFEMKHDPEAAADILALTGAPCVIAKKTYLPEVLIGLMSRMRAVVAMRLHALIFAAGQGVPLVGVSYDVKAMAFLKYLGQDLCCMLPDCTPETLTGLLRECIGREDGKQSRLEAVERLRTLEQGNLEVLREFL